MTSARQEEAPGPSGVRTAFLVARREFVTRARSRVFMVGTALLVIGIPGFIILQTQVLSRTAGTLQVGFQGQAQALAAPLAAAAPALGLDVHTRPVADLRSGRSEVQDGSLDALVSGDPGAPTVTVKDEVNPTLAAALGTVARQVALDRALAASGVSPTTVSAAVAAATVRVDTTDARAGEQTQRIVVGIFVAALLYVALLIYGQIVAQSVVEEKSNRIVEILLPTLRARQLMLGKVVGVGLMGLLQMVLVGAAGLAAVAATGALTIPRLGLAVVAGGLLWFVLGFLLYALLYAAGGALVSRQEDVASVTTPITVVVVATYLAVFWVVGSPDNPLAVLLSVLPPLAPVLMPVRIASGDAQLWQVALAAVLTVATIAGLNFGAGRIYANSVLRTGTRVRLRDAWSGPA